MKCLGIGLLYVFSSLFLSSIGVAVGALSINGSGDAISIFTLLFIGGVLIALTIGALSSMLEVSRGQRILILFLILYMFSYLIGAPEVALFTTYTSSFQVFILIEQLIISLIIANN